MTFQCGDPPNITIYKQHSDSAAQGHLKPYFLYSDDGEWGGVDVTDELLKLSVTDGPQRCYVITQKHK